MSLLLNVVGILVFAIGVGASIALHELGHMVPAKRFGVRVTQYMIGFGPTIWSRKKGETEYGVKGIPLGGYIRMIGMFPPKRGENPNLVRASSTGRLSLLMDQARAQSMEEIGPGDADRVFYKLSVPKKIVIMMGGPTMNLVIAAVLLAITTAGIGSPAASTTLAAVNTCVLPASAPDNASCQPTYPKAPAEAAGLKPGDTIVSFDGKAIHSWTALTTAVRASSSTTVPIVVRRDGHLLTLSISPILTQRPVLNSAGEEQTSSSGVIKTERVGFLGVEASTPLTRQPVSAIPGVIGTNLKATASVFIRIPQKMVGVVHAAFGHGTRDPNGPVSIVGVARFAGEATSDARTSGYGFGGWLDFLLGILAALNLALFVFNLIPLLPLDGGHVAGALWEGARRTVARLRRQADPGPTDVARLLPIAYAASAVLIAMSVLLIYADLVNPIKVG